MKGKTPRSSGGIVNPRLITGLAYPDSIVIVPEPSAGLLGGMGAAAFWAWRHKKKTNRAQFISLIEELA